MNKIDTLIAELCPDGVEYRKLGDVARIVKGETPIQKAVPGDYPLVVTAHGRLSSNEYQFDCEAVCIPLVSSKGHGRAELKEIHYQSGKFALGNILVAVISNNGDTLQASFLQKYLMARKDTLLCPLMRGGANVSIPIDRLKLVKVPVPPIEVQQEIVRIFDTFAALIDTLTEELDCRRQQYAYYRDQLLSLESLEAMDGKPVEMKRLNTLGELFGGYSFKSTEYVSAGARVIRISDVQAGMLSDETPKYCPIDQPQSAQKAKLQEGDLVISLTGNVGRVAVIDGRVLPAYLNQRVEAMRMDSDRVTQRYVFHYLNRSVFTYECEQVSSGSAQKNLSSKWLERYEIPVPSLATQQRIVGILDRFDTLTTSLTDGIPAEIEARRQQYEYYRDRLLDFPRKE